MIKADFTVSVMHGDVYRKEREEIFKQFKKGFARTLITTDVMAQDIEVGSLIINYDMPSNRENYLHRIARKERYARQRRVVINFVNSEEEMKLRDIAIFYKMQIDELPMDLDSLLE